MPIAGAAGNGTTNDTVALQNWINSGSPGGSSGPSGTETYLVSSQLNFTNSGNQTCDFKGATIFINNVFKNLILVNKPSGRLTLNNLTIEGNFKLEEGINVDSIMDSNNLTIKNILSGVNRGNAIGIRIEINANSPRQYGTYNFNNTVIDYVDAVSNATTIGGGDGAARAVIHRWNYNQGNVIINFNGGTFTNIWGVDGDCIQTEDNQQSAPNNSYLRFYDINFGNFTRRHAKVTSGNTEFHRCNFICPDANHPRVIGHTNFNPVPTAVSTLAGMVGDGSSNPGRGHKYIGCLFDGRVGNAQARRMGVTKTTDLEIRDCTFLDYDIDINLYSTTHSASGITICNCSFDSQSRILGTSEPRLATNAVGVGNTTGSGYNLLPASKWYVKNDCPPPGSGPVTNNPPVITLLGENPVTITQFSSYTDAGATAFDDEDQNLTAEIITLNNVNTNLIGTYTVTYNVQDSNGANAPQVTRTVNVIENPQLGGSNNLLGFFN